MNETEKTALIAEWMGWEKRVRKKRYEDAEEIRWKTPFSAGTKFNPLTDENDARQVIEKLMENEKLFLKFLFHFVVLDSVSDGRKSIINYMKSTLTERMDALVSVISNSPHKL